MTLAGLAIVLLVRPRTPGGDLSHGLAVGLVAAYVSFLCGGAWAFAGSQVENCLNNGENTLAFKKDLLQRQKQTIVKPWFLPGLGEVHREVFEPDWQERRYPDLRGKTADQQRTILYDKLVCDVMIKVQGGLLWALPLYFTILFLVPALEALAAGHLWRRNQRPWRVTLAYVERIIPLALTLLYVAVLGMTAFALRDMAIENWFGQFQRLSWSIELALVPMIAAQVGAWRGWSRPVRLLLHAAWIALLLLTYARRGT